MEGFPGVQGMAGVPGRDGAPGNGKISLCGNLQQ